MGNILFFKTQKFKPNDDIPGQNYLCLNVFSVLLLSPVEINKFYTAFRDIDADGSNLISANELRAYFQIEDSPLNRKIFQLFNDDGYLDFMQFVCALWNFLSMDTPYLSDFVFYAYCDRSSMTLNGPGFRKLMSMVHGAGFERNKHLAVVIGTTIRNMEGDKSDVTLTEFSHIVKIHPTVINPILMLQLSLRQKLLGENFWKKLSTRRYEVDDMKKQEFVIIASKAAVDKTNALLMKRRIIAENVARKPPRRSSVAKLMSQMEKIVPLRNKSEIHPVAGSPQKGLDARVPVVRRRRSIIRPDLTTSNDPIERTQGIIELMNNKRTAPQAKYGTSEVLVCVTEANESDIVTTDWKNAGRAHTQGGSPGKIRSGTSSPRSPTQSPRNCNVVLSESPRSGSPRNSRVTSSPRCQLDSYGSPKKGSPRGGGLPLS